MNLIRVISGGQKGTDQAGLRAARTAGIPTGGTATKHWLTEDGPAPWLADYGLIESISSDYPVRTEANVRGSDGTLWFGDVSSAGGKLTMMLCQNIIKPKMIVVAGQTKPSEVRWRA